MNVLSLFDGMSCGRIALERAGLPVEIYIASEIDKYAMQVSKANWPDIKQIGSVEDIGIDYCDFYDETTIYNILTGVSFTFKGKFDLIIGGSPCQGFSFAGLGLNFDDPRSKLFFEYVRLKKRIQELNPSAKFFLENVKMKKEHEAVISDYMGVQPILHNSALVSAQNRKRLYWTNINFLGQPKDRGIVLKDILQTSDFENCIMSDKMMQGFTNRKANTLISRYGKDGKECLIKLGNVHPSGNGMNGAVYSIEGKAPTLTTNKGEGNKIGCVQIGLADDAAGFAMNRRINSPEGKSPTIRSGTGGHHTPKISEEVYLTEEQVARGVVQAQGKVWKSGLRMGNMDFPNNPDKKAKTLTVVTTADGRETNHVKDEFYYRKLTVTECERLQCVPDGYTQRLAAAAKQISNTQAYKMLGNGWNVDSVTHFFLPLNPAYDFMF